MNSPKLVALFYMVIERHLSIKLSEIGPATHFVQETDLTIPLNDGDRGINVAFTMVSKNRLRSDDDFARVLAAIEGLYVDLICQHVPVGQSVQLFCVLAVDKDIEGLDGRPTRLLELGPRMIEVAEGHKEVCELGTAWQTKPIDKP